jgi:hypothetical protein
MTVSVLSLNGEPLAVDGLDDASSVADVRVLTAAVLGCGASTVKLVLAHDVTDPSDGLVKDDQKLVDLPATRFTAIIQSLDVSLLKFTSNETSEYDEGQTDFYKSSSLSYGDTVIWSMSNHKACHIGGWGGSTHAAELSADKMVLTVLTGMVQNRSGEMYGSSDKWAPKMKKFNVEELVTSKGLI